MNSKYQLSNFISACAIGTSKALLLKGAMRAARSDFSLGTQQQVIGFIGNRGLESPKFINSKLWDKNPDPQNEIMVDAYAFFSGYIYGYIAFFISQRLINGLLNLLKKTEI